MPSETQGPAYKFVAHCCNSVESHWAPKSLGFEWKYLSKVLHRGARNPLPCGIRQVPMSGFLEPVPHLPKDNIAPILTGKKPPQILFPQRSPASAFFPPPNRLKTLLQLKMWIWYDVIVSNVNAWSNLFFFTCFKMSAPRHRHTQLRVQGFLKSRNNTGKYHPCLQPSERHPFSSGKRGRKPQLTELMLPTLYRRRLFYKWLLSWDLILSDPSSSFHWPPPAFPYNISFCSSTPSDLNMCFFKFGENSRTQYFQTLFCQWFKW